MLHSLAAKLNALGSVEAIGEAITAELRTIVEYHNCRVYLLQPDGRTLLPIAFRGEYFAEYEEETLEELVTQVGEGMTGWVAETGRSLLTPNAQEVEFAVQIEGTDDIVESMLLVPTKLGRPGERGDRALEHRVREVRRAGPAGRGGARTPRSRRVRERDAAGGRA